MLLLSVADFKLQSIFSKCMTTQECIKSVLLSVSMKRLLNTRSHRHQNLYFPLIDSDNGFLLTFYFKQSKKISNDQELIQSDPTSCPQNQKGNN